MAPLIARIFRNGRNQAVRIPVELSLEAETVTIERQADALILRSLPSGGWDRFLRGPRQSGQARQIAQPKTKGICWAATGVS
jgi:virulence-associated protein VagC